MHHNESPRKESATTNSVENKIMLLLLVVALEFDPPVFPPLVLLFFGNGNVLFVLVSKYIFPAGNFWHWPIALSYNKIRLINYIPMSDETENDLRWSWDCASERHSGYIRWLGRRWLQKDRVEERWSPFPFEMLAPRWSRTCWRSRALLLDLRLLSNLPVQSCKPC